jgi:hypothetical protein
MQSPLLEQAATLRGLAAELAEGRLFEDAMRAAQDSETWKGPIREAFLFWFKLLDSWCRDSLAGGIRLVAEALEARAAALEAAMRQIAVTGAATPVPPPSRLGHSPGTPPGFGNIGGTTAPELDPAQVRLLAGKLAGTADYGIGSPAGFAKRLEAALAPPPAPTGLAPGVPLNPLPPDAAEAAGHPGVYLLIGQALRDAATDITRRADAVAAVSESLPAEPLGDGSFWGRIRDIAARAAEAVADTAGDAAAVAGPDTPAATEPAPRSLVDLERSRRQGAEAAGRVAGIVGVKTFDGQDHEKLFTALMEAERHADDPAFAAAFVESLVPDGLRSWCKLMANSVIDLRVEMDILRPLSRLVGTATQAGEQLEPETRQALLGSSCLDTLVHYGSFDAGFALAAARRILKDPGRYHRVDGSDRVYSQVDRQGHYETGDARVGALALLANNPEAARIIAESKGPSGRTLLFHALEADGPVGAHAAAAVEAGLANLNRTASEDSLEVLIKMVNAGELDLQGPGKACLARLLTSPGMVEKLADATTSTKRGRDERPSDAKGFGAGAGTLEGMFGKILDDEAARAEFSSRLGVQSAVLLKEKAMTYTADSGGDPITPLLGEIADLGNLYQAITEGAYGAATEKEANIYAVAGLKKALSETVKLIPGAALVTTVASTAIETKGGDWIDEFLSADEKRRVENLDPEGLAKELERHLRPLATLALFTNPELVKHLLPPGSPTAARFATWVHYDEQGNPTMTIPPPGNQDESGNAPASWNNFVDALSVERDAQGSAWVRPSRELMTRSKRSSRGVADPHPKGSPRRSPSPSRRNDSAVLTDSRGKRGIHASEPTTTDHPPGRRGTRRCLLGVQQ